MFSGSLKIPLIQAQVQLIAAFTWKKRHCRLK
jgi:hypothetical protein